MSAPISDPVFIYAPRSGDRGVAERAHPEIRVVRYANGCRHVTGGIHLEFEAAQPGTWHRAEARCVAARLVQDHGGIAWDECGTIHMVVPRLTAQRCFRLMARVLPVTTGWRHDEQAPDPLATDTGMRLLLAGLVDSGGAWADAPPANVDLPEGAWDHLRPRVRPTGVQIAEVLAGQFDGVGAGWWKLGGLEEEEPMPGEQVDILGSPRWDEDRATAWIATLPGYDRDGMTPEAALAAMRTTWHALAGLR